MRAGGQFPHSLFVKRSPDIQGGFLFNSVERPFQDLAPLKEKHFCPLLEFFFGNLRSVTVFLMFLEVSWDIFVTRL